MIERFRVPAATTMPFGVPAQPLSGSVLEKLKEGFCSIKGIAEVHLPMIYIPATMQQPSLVLVVVFDLGVDQDPVMPIDMRLVDAAVPIGIHLEVWPLVKRDFLLGPIRKTNCRIISMPTKKSWWKVWRLWNATM